jgi:hypothetical protein
LTEDYHIRDMGHVALFGNFFWLNGKNTIQSFLLGGDVLIWFKAHLTFRKVTLLLSLMIHSLENHSKYLDQIWFCELWPNCCRNCKPSFFIALYSIMMHPVTDTTMVSCVGGLYLKLWSADDRLA